MKIQQVAVFCGSKSGNDDLFELHATSLGRYFIEHQLTLIYGGGNKGMMGAIANSIMVGGGKVIGIMPQKLKDWEQDHQGITELMIVEDMHTRKKKMYDLCDAAVILPGGNGTLDELFEFITWNTLKIHEKPLFILNTAGFYNFIIAHLDKMKQTGFLYGDWREQIFVCETPDEIIACLLQSKIQNQNETQE